jgi:hypothetical protein
MFCSCLSDHLLHTSLLLIGFEFTRLPPLLLYDKQYFIYISKIILYRYVLYILPVLNFLEQNAKETTES